MRMALQAPFAKEEGTHNVLDGKLMQAAQPELVVVSHHISPLTK